MQALPHLRHSRSHKFNNDILCNTHSTSAPQPQALLLRALVANEGPCQAPDLDDVPTQAPTPSSPRHPKNLSVSFNPTLQHTRVSPNKMGLVIIHQPQAHLHTHCPLLAARTHPATPCPLLAARTHPATPCSLLAARTHPATPCSLLAAHTHPAPPGLAPPAA